MERVCCHWPRPRHVHQHAIKYRLTVIDSKRYLVWGTGLPIDNGLAHKRESPSRKQHAWLHSSAQQRTAVAEVAMMLFTMLQPHAPLLPLLPHPPRSPGKGKTPSQSPFPPIHLPHTCLLTCLPACLSTPIHAYPRLPPADPPSSPAISDHPLPPLPPLHPPFTLPLHPFEPFRSASSPLAYIHSPCPAEFTLQSSNPFALPRQFSAKTILCQEIPPSANGSHRK